MPNADLLRAICVTQDVNYPRLAEAVAYVEANMAADKAEEVVDLLLAAISPLQAARRNREADEAARVEAERNAREEAAAAEAKAKKGPKAAEAKAETAPE